MSSTRHAGAKPMHLKSLKIFCDTVSLRSFSKAADENGVSQSNASQVVHQLEERLGLALIDRSTRPFRVTPEGEKYYEGCRSIVRQYDDLERDVRALHGDVAARLTVAAIYSVGLADMSSYLEEFRSVQPKAEVRMEYLHPRRVYDEVESEEADLGVVSFPVKSRRLSVAPWREERMVLVTAPDHPLAGREEVSLEEIDGAPLVAFERGLMIREKLDRILSQHKVDAPIALEFDNIETMKRAIETGAGVGLLPEPTVGAEIASGTLAKIRLVNPSIVRPLGIIYRRDRELSAVAEAFIELLQTHAGDNARAATLETIANR